MKKGVLIIRGTRITIPQGGLIIEGTSDGGLTGRMTLHVGYEMYPQWLRLALEHALCCQQSANELDNLWIDGSREVEIDALEAELRSGMQACISAGAAIDGFYGTLVELAPPPKALRDKWRNHRTARYKQTAEIIRQTTRIGPKSFAAMRDQLKLLFKFRNEAIHPTGAARVALPHPRLDVDTERRIAMYTAANALDAAESAVNIIGSLLNLPNKNIAPIIDHFEIAKEWIYPIASKWEIETGRQLFSRLQDNVL